MQGVRNKFSIHEFAFLIFVECFFNFHFRMWFHRPLKADEWVLFAVSLLVSHV